VGSWEVATWEKYPWEGVAGLNAFGKVPKILNPYLSIYTLNS